MYRGSTRQIKAQAAVHKAVKNKQLEKKSCEEDGCSISRTSAHHYLGYEEKNWLDVIWYCRAHHAKNHITKSKNIRDDLIYDLYRKKIIIETIAYIFRMEVKTIKLVIKRKEQNGKRTKGFKPNSETIY